MRQAKFQGASLRIEASFIAEVSSIPSVLENFYFLVYLDWALFFKSTYLHFVNYILYFQTSSINDTQIHGLWSWGLRSTNPIASYYFRYLLVIIPLSIKFIWPYSVKGEFKEYFFHVWPTGKSSTICRPWQNSQSSCKTPTAVDIDEDCQMLIMTRWSYCALSWRNCNFISACFFFFTSRILFVKNSKIARWEVILLIRNVLDSYKVLGINFKLKLSSKKRDTSFALLKLHPNVCLIVTNQTPRLLK